MHVYAVYHDGQHIDCFLDRLSAERFVEEKHGRYWDVVLEEYDAGCDCGNQRIAFIAINGEKKSLEKDQ